MNAPGIRPAFAGLAIAGAVAFCPSAFSQNGLKAEYYDTSVMAGYTPPPPRGSPEGGETTNAPTVTRIDEVIDFDFETPPAPGLPGNNFFMAAWTGMIRITTAGSYKFRILSDDGCRMWITVGTPQSRIINGWSVDWPTDRDSAFITLPAGDTPIRIEYFERDGGEVCTFSYQGPDTGNSMVVVPTAALVPPPPPPAPVLTASPGPGRVELSWTASVGASTYRLDRGLAPGGPFTLLATDLSGQGTWDTAVALKTIYSYRAFARNLESQTGPASNVAFAEPEAPPPPEPDTPGRSSNGCGSSPTPARIAISVLACGVLAIVARRP